MDPCGFTRPVSSETKELINLFTVWSELISGAAQGLGIFVTP